MCSDFELIVCDIHVLLDSIIVVHVLTDTSAKLLNGDVGMHNAKNHGNKKSP